MVRAVLQGHLDRGAGVGVFGSASISTMCSANAFTSAACSLAGAGLWALVNGVRYAPATSELVVVLCAIGMLGYTSAVGYVVHAQNRRLASALEALGRSEERYRLIAENAGDLIAMIDHEGRWLYTSPSYQRIIDAAELAPGADAFRRIHPDDAEQARIAVLRASPTPNPREIGLRLIGKDGRLRQYRTRVHAINGHDGPPRLVLVSQEFDRNIRNDSRTIQVTAAELEGLPQDYLDAHKPGPDGRITISIEYPDRFPVMTYAKNGETRRRLQHAALNRAWPANRAVLDSLIAKRHRLATTLGYRNWADYITADKMIGSGAQAAEFIDRMLRPYGGIGAHGRDVQPRGPVLAGNGRPVRIGPLARQEIGQKGERVHVIRRRRRRCRLGNGPCRLRCRADEVQWLGRGSQGDRTVDRIAVRRERPLVVRAQRIYSPLHDTTVHGEEAHRPWLRPLIDRDQLSLEFSVGRPGDPENDPLLSGRCGQRALPGAREILLARQGRRSRADRQADRE